MISMYNDKISKSIKKDGSINILNCISIMTDIDIDILKKYYNFYKDYPKLSDTVCIDEKFKIFERKYKIIKLFKNK